MLARRARPQEVPTRNASTLRSCGWPPSRWLFNLRLLAAPLLIGALFISCGGSASNESGRPGSEVDAPTEPAASPAPGFAPLTGKIISNEDRAALEARRPLAVMIDNIVTATPQAGLDQADIVFEALVEGGITRYLAIFHSQEPEVIGPVRSARTPFLQWAAEYDALYVHVGSAETDGPADAGQQIRDWHINDVDLGAEAFRHNFVRDSNRPAPHNVFINSAELRARASELGLEGAPMFAIWPYSGAEGLTPGTPAPGFTVSFGPMSPNFSVHWGWDVETLRYERSQFGEPQFDAVGGNRVGFTNVIVQYADARVVDSSGHVLLDNIGEGRTQVFRDGQVIEGTWRKADLRSHTEFFGLDGNPLSLMTGTTWVEVVPPNGGTVFD